MVGEVLAAPQALLLTADRRKTSERLGGVVRAVIARAISVTAVVPEPSSSAPLKIESPFCWDRRYRCDPCAPRRRRTPCAGVAAVENADDVRRGVSSPLRSANVSEIARRGSNRAPNDGARRACPTSTPAADSTARMARSGRPPPAGFRSLPHRPHASGTRRHLPCEHGRVGVRDHDHGGRVSQHHALHERVDAGRIVPVQVGRDQHDPPLRLEAGGARRRERARDEQDRRLHRLSPHRAHQVREVPRGARRGGGAPGPERGERALGVEARPVQRVSLDERSRRRPPGATRNGGTPGRCTPRSAPGRATACPAHPSSHRR